jgi:hypothetical protein
MYRASEKWRTNQADWSEEVVVSSCDLFSAESVSFDQLACFRRLQSYRYVTGNGRHYYQSIFPTNHHVFVGCKAAEESHKYYLHSLKTFRVGVCCVGEKP